ncbi:MAG: hypothetical protein ACO3FK_08915 [Vulcanococcus sp.]
MVPWPQHAADRLDVVGGAGITAPYKVAVIPMLDAVDDDACAIGAPTTSRSSRAA